MYILFSFGFRILKVLLENRNFKPGSNKIFQFLAMFHLAISWLLDWPLFTCS